jgi:hypothetical protein
MSLFSQTKPPALKAAVTDPLDKQCCGMFNGLIRIYGIDLTPAPSDAAARPGDIVLIN